MQIELWEKSFRREALWLLIFAALLLLPVHFLMGNGYGFHRDELQFLDDARHLHWGFAAYPPMTSFCGRIAIALFGISPQVLRLPAALLNVVSLLLVGLTARELGGRRLGQVFAMLAAFPAALAFSSVLQYNTPDMLAWCLLVFSTARVLRTSDERWWLISGVGAGLGVLSKYTIALTVLSLLIGLVLLPSARRHLRSRWFWYGALIAAAIAAPNLLWLARHGFLTLRMEHAIHLRDVRLGRARGFLLDQFRCTLLALPLAVAGLVSLLRSSRFRLLASFYLGPFALLLLMKGRGYYLLPAYPVLYAAGAVVLETALDRWQSRSLLRQTSREGPRPAMAAIVCCSLLTGAALVAWAYLPVWPVRSAAWTWQMRHNEDMANEVGWLEIAGQVAAVRDGLSPAERNGYAVLADNFGDAGAIALYGPKFGLPVPISPVNSFYDRGYGLPQETVIVVGSRLRDEHNFQSCRVAGHVVLPDGVHNEETDEHPEILVCHHLLLPWAEAWKEARRFG